MTISATVRNKQHQHDIEVITDGQSKTISIPSRPSGFGSSVNGGEKESIFNRSVLGNCPVFYSCPGMM